jgi:hypothetical protein
VASEPNSSGEEEVSEYVRRPTRTAGDLSEVAEAAAGITTEDLARDLETAASKQGALTDKELLADLLERVKRIEGHLGLTSQVRGQARAHPPFKGCSKRAPEPESTDRLSVTTPATLSAASQGIG